MPRYWKETYRTRKFVGLTDDGIAIMEQSICFIHKSQIPRERKESESSFHSTQSAFGKDEREKGPPSDEASQVQIIENLSKDVQIVQELGTTSEDDSLEFYRQATIVCPEARHRGVDEIAGFGMKQSDNSNQTAGQMTNGHAVIVDKQPKTFTTADRSSNAVYFYNNGNAYHPEEFVVHPSTDQQRPEDNHQRKSIWVPVLCWIPFLCPAGCDIDVPCGCCCQENRPEEDAYEIDEY